MGEIIYIVCEWDEFTYGVFTFIHAFSDKTDAQICMETLEKEWDDKKREECKNSQVISFIEPTSREYRNYFLEEVPYKRKDIK